MHLARAIVRYDLHLAAGERYYNTGMFMPVQWQRVVRQYDGFPNPDLGVLELRLPAGLRG
jgi:hypothetical protein